MLCVNCNREVQPAICTGAEIYGKLFAFKNNLYVRCPLCGNYGDHDDADPFFVIPDFTLRKAYSHIEAKLNCLTMQRVMTEEEVAKWMSDRLYNGSKRYRTHDLATRDEAVQAYKLAKELYNLKIGGGK